MWQRWSCYWESVNSLGQSLSAKIGPAWACNTSIVKLLLTGRSELHYFFPLQQRVCVVVHNLFRSQGGWMKRNRIPNGSYVGSSTWQQKGGNLYWVTFWVLQVFCESLCPLIGKLVRCCKSRVRQLREAVCVCHWHKPGYITIFTCHALFYMKQSCIASKAFKPGIGYEENHTGWMCVSARLLIRRPTLRYWESFLSDFLCNRTTMCLCYVFHLSTSVSQVRYHEQVNLFTDASQVSFVE